MGPKDPSAGPGTQRCRSAETVPVPVPGAAAVGVACAARTRRARCPPPAYPPPAAPPLLLGVHQMVEAAVRVRTEAPVRPPRPGPSASSP
ncbi:DUF6629 family protein [Streptomyces sp. QTS137]